MGQEPPPRRAPRALPGLSRTAPSLALPCLAAAAQAFTFTNHAPLVPLLMADLGITPTQAGLLTTATFVMAGAAQGAHGGAIQLGVAGAIFILPATAEWLGWRGSMALSVLPLVIAWTLWTLGARPTPPPRPGRASGVYGNLAIWRLGLAHTAMFGTSIVLGARGSPSTWSPRSRP